MARNEVRIIGGKWKGRKLVFPASDTLRPTLGRVRETLFNWLVADITDALCLDLFAGSGALGFEALSRGARRVTFVDNHHPAVSALRQNVTHLLGDDAARGSARVCRRNAGQFLRQCPTTPEECWDVIFLDPPFESQALEQTLTAIASRELLKQNGTVYVEMRASTPLRHPQWEFVKSSRAGDSQFGLLARKF